MIVPLLAQLVPLPSSTVVTLRRASKRGEQGATAVYKDHPEYQNLIIEPMFSRSATLLSSPLPTQRSRMIRGPSVMRPVRQEVLELVRR
eukprot:3866076-Pyramimonas_sp.AAC.1